MISAAVVQQRPPSAVATGGQGPAGPKGGGRDIYATWAALSAITGPSANYTAEVPLADTGTHTDPVVGGTVNNSGIFSWSNSPAGWQRIADVDAVAAKSYADQAQAILDEMEATPIAQVLPSTRNITIGGVQPLGVIDIRNPSTGILYSFMSFMPDGSLLSQATLNLVQGSLLAGAKLNSITAPNWGDVVMTKVGPDGLKYVVWGKRADGTFVGSSGSGSTYYPPATPILAADAPAYSATGWNGFVTYGQSLSVGRKGTPPITTSAPTGQQNLTFAGGPLSAKAGNAYGAVNTSPGTTGTTALIEFNYDGVGYTAADGGTNNGETICSGAMNAAVRRAASENAIATAAFVNFAFGGGHGAYQIGSLSPSSPPTSADWYNNLKDLISEAKARATAAAVTYALHAVAYMQGQADAAAGVSRSTYLSKLTALRSTVSTDALAITGQAKPVHFLVDQINGGGTTLAQTNAIQLAEMDAVNQDAHIHFVTPVYHIFAAGCGDSDGLHMHASGYAWEAEYFGRAYKQLVIDGRVPDCVWPISATANGTELRIKFRVPQAPLVLDTSAVPPTTDKGFLVSDGTGTLTLSNIHIENGDTVVITLNRTLGTSPVVRYALDFNGAGALISFGATGNLRDSTAETRVIGGVTRSLAHWAPHFQQPIIVIG